GAPPGAQAHVRSGVVAVSYRATVVTRPPAISATVDRSDLALRIGVPAGHAVVVGGYLGEPFARIDARGVAVNAASPTAAATGLAKRGHGWRRVSRGRTLTWHDARVRGLPAGVDHGNWAVPVTVDGRRSRLTGLI